MARIARNLIQSLINPAGTQGLFELGQAIGSAPGRAMEQQKEKTFQDKMATIQSQGTAAAQEDVADPIALDKRIQELYQIARIETNPQRAESARKAAQALEAKKGQVRGYAAANQQKGIVELQRALDAGQFDANPQAKAQLEARVKSFETNPNVRPGLEAYRKEKAGASIEEVITQLTDPTLPPDKIADLTNKAYIQARMSGVDEGQVRSRIITANTQRNSQRKTMGEQQIDSLMVQMLQSQNPEEMNRLEAQMVEMAPTYGLSASDYIGKAKEIRLNRDKEEATATAARLKAEDAAQDQLAEQVASIMRDQDIADVPRSIPLPDGGEMPIDDKTATKIKDIIVERNKKDNDFAEIANGKKIPQEYIDAANKYMESYGEAFATTEVKKAINVLSSEAKTSSAIRSKAVSVIRTAVDAFDKDMKNARTSDAALDREADVILQTISRQDDYVWGGGTVRDAIIDNDEIVPKLKKNIVQVLKENPNFLQDPNVNLQAIVDQATRGLEQYFPEERTQAKRAERKSERAKTLADKKAVAIQYLIDQGMTEAEAEAELIKRKAGSAVSNMSFMAL